MANFIKNIKHVVSANVIAQALNLISLPIISRLYSPEDFGLFSTFVVIQGILLSFSTFKAEWLIPNQSLKRRATSFFYAGVLGCFSVCLVITFICGVYIAFNPDGLSEDISVILPFIGISCLFSSYHLMIQGLYIRERELQIVAKSKILQSLVTVLLTIFLGLNNATFSDMIMAYVFGFIVAIITLYKGSNKLNYTVAITRNRLFMGLNSLKKYKVTFLEATKGSVINVLLNNVMLLLIVFLFGAFEAGLYGMIHRILTAPISLLTNAVVQSFWAESATLKRNAPEKLQLFYFSVLQKLIILAIFISAAIAIVSFSGLLPLVLGQEKWSEANNIMLSLLPTIFGIIVFSPTTHLIVYGKIKWQMYADLLSLICVVFSFLMLFKLGYSLNVCVFVASALIFCGYLVKFKLHLKANRQLIQSLSYKNIKEG